MDLPLVEVYNFLNKGETNPQPLCISKRFCFFLKMSREDFLQGLMGDSNPCIGNAGENKFSILFKAHTDPPSLTVVFNGIGEKVVEELVEFIFNSGDLHRSWRELSFQSDLMFLGHRFA